MAIRSRVQLRKDAEHKRQSEITDKAVRKAEKITWSNTRSIVIGGCAMTPMQPFKNASSSS